MDELTRQDVLFALCRALILGDIAALGQRIEQVTSQLRQLRTTRRSGCFEWVDSVLVKALQAGNWLLVDNVNFCRYLHMCACNKC